MKVHIQNNIYIESDSMQFIIKEYTGRVVKDAKTGKESEHYNIHGYFSNVKSAVNHILKMKIMESTATTLKEWVEEMKRLNEWVESLLSETA